MHVIGNTKFKKKREEIALLPFHEIGNQTSKNVKMFFVWKKEIITVSHRTIKFIDLQILDRKSTKTKNRFIVYCKLVC